MTPFQAIKTCLTDKYADFKGRASRSEFWWFILSVYAILFLIAFGMTLAFSHNASTPLSQVLFALVMLMMLALMVPMLSVLVRRMHDIGKSGWWLFISFIPWIGSFILLFFLLMPSKEPIDETLSVEQDIAEPASEKEISAEEDPSRNEDRKKQAIFTLPLLFGLAIGFAPFTFWVVNGPQDMIIGQGAVALLLLIIGIGVFVWKKLSWPKDKWLWISSAVIAVPVLAAIVCRLASHSIMYLTLSLFLLYPICFIYFSIRLWQANKG